MKEERGRVLLARWGEENFENDEKKNVEGRILMVNSRCHLRESSSQHSPLDEAPEQSAEEGKGLLFCLGLS